MEFGNKKKVPCMEMTRRINHLLFVVTYFNLQMCPMISARFYIKKHPDINNWLIMNSLLSHHRKFDIFMLYESKHIKKSALSACVFIMSLPKILTTNLEKVRRPRQILLIHARPENMTE